MTRSVQQLTCGKLNKLMVIITYFTEKVFLKETKTTTTKNPKNPAFLFFTFNLGALEYWHMLC